MKSKLAERIRLLRVQHGLSQQNMADELNLTVAAYSNIERGVTDINITRLTQISHLLGTTPSAMLSEDNMVSDAVDYNYNTMSSQVSILSQQLNVLQQQFHSLQTEIAVLKSKL